MKRAITRHENALTVTLRLALNKAPRECINDIFHMFLAPITGQVVGGTTLKVWGWGEGFQEGADVSRQSVRYDVTGML